MSMSLKKGQKAFKPKFAARRSGAPASAQSSARPSVERQSQTPVPSTRPAEPISIPDQDGDVDMPDQVSVIDQSTPQPPTITTTSQSPLNTETNGSSNPAENVLKRSAVNDEDSDIARKRARIDPPQSTISTTPQPSLDAEVANTDNTPENALKEIAVDDESSDHTQKGARLDPNLSNDVEEGTEAPDEPSTTQQSTHTRSSQMDISIIVSQTGPQVHISDISASSTQTHTSNTVAIGRAPIAEDLSNCTAPILPLTTDTSTHSPNLTRDGITSDSDNTTFQENNTSSQTTTITSTITPGTGLTYLPPREHSPEVRQDDPASLYPDPELSGLPFVRTGVPQPQDIVSGAALNPDGTVVGEPIPAVALNPDGTHSDIVQATTLNPDGTPRINAPPGAKITKAKRKTATKRRRFVQAEQDGEDARPTIEMQINRPRRRKGSAEKQPRKKKQSDKERRPRGETPEGAENEIIDRTAMTMGELCKDLKIGEKSSRHDELKAKQLEAKQKAKEAKRRKKLAEAGIIVEGGTPAPAEEGADEGATTAGDIDEEPEESSGIGPQMMNINGQLVLNYRSLEVARNNGKEGPVKVLIRENEFSRIVTSGSHMKRELPSSWDANDTALFYKGLSMFGTDFEMMAKLFPARNRRQIKLKYAIEERDNKRRLDRVLTSPKIPIDIELFTEYHKDDMADVEEIEDEMRKFEENELRAEEEKRLEREEADRQKRAEIQSRGAPGRRKQSSGDGSGKENDSAPAPSTGKGGRRKAPKNFCA